MEFERPMNLKNYSRLFVLWTIQGLIAFLWLLLIPTESGVYSVSRLLLIGCLAVPTVTFAILAVRFRSIDWNISYSSPRLYKFIYVAAFALFLLPPVGIAILLELGQTVGNIYTSYAERLAPLAFLSSATGTEWCIWHIGAKKPDFSNLRPVLATTLKILLLVVPVAVTVYFTHWGVSPIEDGSFGNPPTPLLEWQIGLAVLVGITAMLAEPYLKMRRLDVVLSVLVYLTTCLVWLADPLIPGYFATPPRAPNFEPYPFSDPLIYAQYSQSALVGEGFLWPDIPARPFYVMLLTWMYAIAGQNYQHVIFLQTILLAFFPAVLYLLGRELGSRPLGLALALLAVLRDLTANRAAPFALNYSYSKLFISEMSTALVLVIFTILIIRWMKSPKPTWLLLLMGGVLGIASLIRLQSAVLFAPMALLTIFPMWEKRRLEWLKGMLIITLGLLLTFSPWLVRNYYAADGLVLDNPISQSMTFARRWSGDNGNTMLPQLPGESTAQYVSRMNGIAMDGFKREPGRVLNAAAGHFVNNLISSLHTFPVRDRIDSPSELLWPTRAFWQTGARSPWLSSLYMILLAIGLASAWTTFRLGGLLPFLFSLAYNAWTALFLSSGDRFLVPVDWTWHLYFVLGLLTLAKLALSGMQDFQWPPVYTWEHVEAPARASNWKQTALAAGLVLFVGMSLPLTEFVFPEKYPAMAQEKLSAESGIAPLDGEVIAYGRAVYPRYYQAGEGEPGSAKLGYGRSDEARLVFWLVGPDPGLVIFPLDTTPEFFPHASDVWIVGKMEDGALRARIIKVDADVQTATYEE